MVASTACHKLGQVFQKGGALLVCFIKLERGKIIPGLVIRIYIDRIPKDKVTWQGDSLHRPATAGIFLFQAAGMRARWRKRACALISGG